MALIAFVTDQTDSEDVDLSALLDLGCRYFGAELGVFCRFGGEIDCIEAVGGSVALVTPGQTLSGDRRLSLALASDGAPAVMEQCAGDVPAFFREAGIEALLTCPLRSTRSAQAALYFADRRMQRFDDRDRQILQFVATWLATREDARKAWHSYQEAHKRLTTSDARYRTLYEKTPALLHSIDDKGRLASVSDSWLQTMGYERDDVVGRPSTDFLTAESRRYAKDVVLPAYRANGRCDDVAYQFVTKNGEIRDVLLSAISQYDDDGSFFRSLAVLQDVTERRRVERMLAERTAALERSNADLAHFAHIASHDLQEPLRRIIAYSEILKEDFGPELSEDAAEMAGIIQSGGRRLRLMINDLLAYVRVSEQVTRAFEPVDMSAVLCHALDDLDDEIVSRNVRVDMAQLPLVWGRAPLLKMVLHHLLSNAIRHGGGSSPAIDISVGDVGDVWQFAVADRGTGVEPKFADRIFEMFQRLHLREEREGSGTGLAICRLIIQRCGGEIWLDRSYGDGARFLFTLPKEKPELMQPLSGMAPIPASGRTARTP